MGRGRRYIEPAIADRVVALIKQGLSDRAIAKQAGIARGTVKKINHNQWKPFVSRRKPKRWWPREVARCSCGAKFERGGVDTTIEPPTKCLSCRLKENAKA